MFLEKMNLALMIPLRRCGSNAIRLRLSQHPSLFCPYPIHIADIEESKYGELSEDENYFRLIVDIIHLQSTSLVPWKGLSVFDPEEVMEWVKDKKPRSKNTIYTELLIRAGIQKEVSLVMDKSQDSVQDWRTWISLYPNIRFLDIVRDPRAQVSSMNEAIIYDYETTLNTQRWVKSRQYVDEINKEFPNNILTVRFEDFILDEVSSLNKIFNFFGVETLSSISIFESQEAKKMSERSPLWSSNFSDPNPSVFEKFKKHLTNAEIEHIETVTYPYLFKYGYEKQTIARTLLPYTIKEALKRSDHKKEIIWKKLEKNHPRDYFLRKKRQFIIQNSPFI